MRMGHIFVRPPPLPQFTDAVVASTAADNMVSVGATLFQSPPTSILQY